MIYIRVDMNEIIATGHLMRCLAIAEAAKKQGEETTFLLADAQAETIVREKGYHAIVLHTDWKQMDSELVQISRIIKEKHIQKIFIDSYQVTQSYLQRLTELVETIYLDDLNMFDYPVSGIVCYAYYYEKFDYTRSLYNRKMYLGPEYTILKPAFCDCPPKSINFKVENLLILSGGTDRYNILDGILSGIEKNDYQSICVICGTYYHNYAALCRKFSNNKKVHIYQNVSNIEKFMQEADFAITAGGTTLYELCAVGTPAISYSIADNQKDNVIKFQEEGIIDYAGDVRKDNVVQKIKDLLKKYENNAPLRQSCSEKMQQLVDGGGAERVASILCDIS